ncbi:hypothetical protein NFI96_004827 [Prochilodus magdalenae]|nr:hypothetical protein NFI96_004827 [Prochilodus magdalenae]
MKVLLVFSLFLVSVGGGESRTVRGYPGGGVLIRCRYERRYTSNKKYLCKGAWPNCPYEIMKEVKNEWRSTGRFSLLDNTRAAEFWVMIRDLTVQDSGMYQCGIDKAFIDVYTPVELTVEKDLSYEKNISVIGHVGGGVNISCKYPQSLRSHPKFLCRRVDTECKYTTSVKESRRWRNEGNLNLHYDGPNQTFTVSINSLTEGDSGEYWCGAESDWTSNNGYKVYITQVNLSVTDAHPSTRNSSLTPGPSTPTTSKTTSSSARDFPVTIVITIVSVILVLLLIGLLFFILVLQKRSRPRGLNSIRSQSLTDSIRRHRATSTVYEEVNDGKHLPASDPGDSSVYYNAGAPTDISEPSQTVYDNVPLHSSSSDMSNPVYSPTELPSDPPDQDIYSTPQLPTIPSDSSRDICPLLVGGGESRTVRGYPGGGVLIKCGYERSYTLYPKYFCKGSSPNCVYQIITGVKKWINKGRFSLLDNTSSAEFWVMIRDLTVEDSGLYQCGVEILELLDILTPVELTVMEDLSYEKTISVIGYFKGGVDINCTYPQSLSSDPKFICRRVGTADCIDSRGWVYKGRFSPSDNGNQTFSVSINSLTEGDSGEYWCGAESDWTSDDGYKVYITQVHLRVTENKIEIEMETSDLLLEVLLELGFSTKFQPVDEPVGYSDYKAKVTGELLGMVLEDLGPESVQPLADDDMMMMKEAEEPTADAIKELDVVHEEDKEGTQKEESLLENPVSTADEQENVREMLLEFLLEAAPSQSVQPLGQNETVMMVVGDVIHSLLDTDKTEEAEDPESYNNMSEVVSELLDFMMEEGASTSVQEEPGKEGKQTRRGKKTKWRKVDCLFLVSVGGGESRTVRGYPGGGVLIRCRYDRGYTSNPKYLCTGSWPCMTKPVWTGVKNEWRSTGRFSLLDNTSSAEFWVMIRDLTVQDSGYYKCAVEKALAIDFYTPVELTVEEDLSYEQSISVIGHIGGGVNISCKYPQSLSSYPKFLCRRVGTAECNYTTPVKESRRWRNVGNLNLHDDGKQIFTVSINSLTERDSGEYWCGAESDWTSDDGYRVYITQVHLRVTASPPPAFPVSSVITGVSVMLVLLLIGLSFLTVALRKRIDIDWQLDVYTPVELAVEEDPSYEKNISVIGHVGGGVNISCTYPQFLSRDPKFLCWRVGTADCKYTTSVKESRRWRNEGNLNLHDDGNRTFTVVINSLTEGDSGEYWCGAESDWTSDDGYKVYITQVNLRVTDPAQRQSCRGSTNDHMNPLAVCEEMEDGKHLWTLDAGGSTVYCTPRSPTYTSEPHQAVYGLSYEKNISVIGHVEGGVNISCTYPQSLSRDPKFLCRRVNTTDCNYTTSVNESRRWRNEGRFSLHDDGNQTFTVVINNLTEGDSGEYWCGAESDWTSDDGYRVYITQVNLSVTDTVPQPSTHISSETTTPTTSPAPETTPASATDSPPPGFPDSSVFLGIVSGILVLILIGLVFFILTSRKRSKTPASVQSQPDRNPSYDYTFSPPVSVYEEIKDTRHHPTSDDGGSTVYSAVHPPTDDSEASQAVYGNVQTPSSGGFPQAVYSTAQLPSNPPDQDTYSTAQLPTIPSDSSAPAAECSDGEPEEGLTYATVKLSKKAGGSTDSVPGAAFNKEKDPSGGY